MEVEEKHNDHHVETYSDDVNKVGDHEEQRHYANIDEGFDPHEIKRIVRKIDYRLIPILSAMYCISLIDRTNLSLARAANSMQMQKDLRLDIGYRYSIAALVFFIPYIILEIPVSIRAAKHSYPPLDSITPYPTVLTSI
jgi:hypothetical protein